MRKTRKSAAGRDESRKILDGRAPSILVIEDDADFGETVCEILKISGYEVRLAADGIAAFDALSDGHLPDLILLDLMMPRMDGWAFRQLQLKTAKVKDIPVIALSATTEVLKPIEADLILPKPILPDELVDAVRKLLERRAD